MDPLTQALLTQLLGQQRQNPSPVSSIPASMDFGANWPELQQAPAPLPPEDMIVSPDPNRPRTPDQRMEGFRRLLTNFTYSLGTGLEKASAGGEGRGLRTTAGIGAILTLPEQVRQAQEALQMKKDAENRAALGLLLQAKQADATAGNYASLAQSRDAAAQDRDQMYQLKVKTEQDNADLRQKVYQLQKQAEDERERIAKLPKKVGQSEGVGPDGFPITVDHMQKSDGTLEFVLGPEIWKKPEASKLLDPAVEAQRIRIAKASQVDPSQVVQFETSTGSRFGIVNKATRVITPVLTADGAEVMPKLPEPPAALKTQGTAAAASLQQVDNIERMLRENPQLVGPLAGRFGDFMRGVGTNPFIGTKDVELGAQLSEHLKALFAQELRSLFPGRTNSDMQKEIASVSPQMGQDPNIMMGYLAAIRRNQGIVLNDAIKQGWVPERAAIIPKPPNAAPAAGGVAPEGTVITLKDGTKQVKRGGKWVNQ